MDPNSFAIMMDTVDQVLQVFCAVALMGLIVLGAVWVVKIRTGARLNKHDEAMLLNVNGQMQKMETRMAALERILDAEVPAWRAGFEETGESYGRKMG